jgi:hypothetical protein
MFKVQKKSSNLLDAEVEELENDLIKNLYEITNDSLDVHHACLILLEKGVININELRNFSLIRDYDTMLKNPLEKQMSIYYNLSVKYDLSVDHLRKIINNKKYRG